jgi:hypothetical protein
MTEDEFDDLISMLDEAIQDQNERFRRLLELLRG